jgi:hypothetical protein
MTWISPQPLVASLAGLCFLASASIAVASTSTPVKADVKVNMVQNTASEFLVTVDHAKQRYRFATFVPEWDSPTEGIGRQRGLSGWKGDYLFVRHQCGQVANWRCVVDQVFTFHQGNLIHLGGIESRDCKELGCRYDEKTGLFRDIHDAYQVNPVTGQTDSPPLAVLLRADPAKRRFTTDLDATWQLNAALFSQSMSCLDLVAEKGFGEKCASGVNPWSSFLSAAKLARIAGREKEWSTLFAVQAKGYCAKSADTRCEWRMRGIEEFYSKLGAGQLSTSVPSQITLTSVDRAEPSGMTPQKLPAAKPIKLGS